MARPKFAREHAIVYDWLAANGVKEWIPEDPVIAVDWKARTITYTAFRWNGPRGFDAENLRIEGNEAPVEQRTVPLVVEPDDMVTLRLAHMEHRANQARRR